VAALDASPRPLAPAAGALRSAPPPRSAVAFDALPRFFGAAVLPLPVDFAFFVPSFVGFFVLF